MQQNSIKAKLQYVPPAPVEYNYDYNTLLLMHFDTSPTLDSSVYNHKINIVGQPSIISNSKIGKGALYLDGSSCLFFNDINFQFFSQNIDWTFEFWFLPSENFSDSRQCIVSTHANHVYNNGDDKEWFNFLEFMSGSFYSDYFFQRTNHRSRWGLTSRLYYNSNDWNHIAFVRNSQAYNDNFKLYLNGIDTLYLDISPSETSQYLYLLQPFNLIPDNMHLFGFPSITDDSVLRFFQGVVDELRISNVVRYTSDFTPPTVPFSPYID